MRSTIRFWLNGALQEIPSCAPTRSMLDWLRQERHLCGTKEGCGEGDCGACTVAVGELHDGRLEWRAYNACILFLPALDGKAVLTVEGLQRADGSLHPVQQAMIDQHGAQCGFCTPGFVMSLFTWRLRQAGHGFDRAELDLELAGNLCRCTGYTAIARAADQALTVPRDEVERSTTQAAQQVLEGLEHDEPLACRHAEGLFFAPRSLDALCRLRVEHADATLVAGATDVGLWVTKQLRPLPVVIYTGRVAELRECALEDHGAWLSIGAAVTYSDALPILAQHFPGLGEMLERLGAVQVRNAGTIGGNIANGSPIGDMPPALIALGAKLELVSSHSRRELDLEDFFIAYGRQDLQAGEVVSRVRVPVGPAGLFACYKLSKRFEQDISAVCGAFAVTLDGDSVSGARICFGGMAGVPARARQAEQALHNRPWSAATVQAAMTAMHRDFEPISDMRASAGYRMRSAANLLWRFFLEHSDPGTPVRLQSRRDLVHEERR